MASKSKVKGKVRSPLVGEVQLRRLYQVSFLRFRKFRHSVIFPATSSLCFLLCVASSGIILYNIIVDVCICAVFIFYSKYFFSGVGGWTEVVYIFFLYLCFYLFMYVCRAICMYACMYACMVITNTR